MDNEEFTKLCEEAKAQGLEDKDILAILFEAFKKGDLEKDELEKLAGAMGYETTEEFKSLIDEATEDAEAPAEAPAEGGEGITEEEVEDAQEVDEGEGEEAEEEKEDASEDKESDDKEMSEDEEKEEARKLFDLD